METEEVTELSEWGVCGTVRLKTGRRDGGRELRRWMSDTDPDKGT